MMRRRAASDSFPRLRGRLSRGQTSASCQHQNPAGDVTTPEGKTEEEEEEEEMPPSPSPLRTRGPMLGNERKDRSSPTHAYERSGGRRIHARRTPAAFLATLLQLDFHPHALRLAIGRVLPAQQTALC